MPRPLFDSEYIFGLHDAGGEQLMVNAGKPGWVVFTEAIGHDPNDRNGTDYTLYSSRGLGVISRLNNGYSPDGTIPSSSQYVNFAQRCANFVARTPGCKIWVIGNEMNYALERPPAVPAVASIASTATPTFFGKVAQTAQSFLQRITGGAQTPTQPAVIPPSSPPRAFATAQTAALGDGTEVITPTLYTQCYQLCRAAIHALPGHADDQVLIGAVAPWNNQTTYAGNPNGDWVQYLQDILTLVGPAGCDGITIHTYTHQALTSLITDESMMNPPFDNRHFQFRAYMDFMQAIPATMRSLPVYITETNEDEPWLEKNIGWVQAAYGEINWWNHTPGNQQIRALVLYRWPRNIDRWGIEGKGAVIEDFQAALLNDYRWAAPSPPVSFHQGVIVETQDVVNLRRTPGYVGKPDGDVLLAAPAQSRLVVLSDAASSVDGLTWWNVQTQNVTPPVSGWAAQFSPTGAPLLLQVDDPTKGNGAMFVIGDQVVTQDSVRMRRSAGSANKPASDVIAVIAANTTLTVTAGPTPADGLVWWRVKGPGPDGTIVEGWMAQAAANGQVLLALATRSVPPPTFQIGDRVATRDLVRLRRTPGYVGKPDSDIITTLAQGTQGTVSDGPRSVDSLTWWQVDATVNSAALRGWVAEKAPNGDVLIERTSAPVPPPPAFAIGDLIVTTDIVRVRRSTGFSNKPANDVLGQFDPKFTLNIIEGPQSAENLTWWRVGGITLSVGEVIGWVAQQTPDGQVLLARATKLPGTNIPDKAGGVYLGPPFQGHFGIAQLWGENPQIYSSITYDGVPLKGHNGIDFPTPVGTPLLAIDDGVVTDAVLNDPTGFGNYIKLRHSWGESIYAHMDSLGVQQGQSVQRGNLLGRSGSSGFANGPHLHFAIRINPYSRTDGWGGFSDPLPYMNPSDFQLPAYVLGPLPASMLARQAVPAASKPLKVAPGYAPDKPGVRRP